MQMSKTTYVVITAVLVGASYLLGRVMSNGSEAGGPHEHAKNSGELAGETSKAQEIWTCSMHPQVRLPEPGQCPICGMDLIPASSGGDADEGLGPRALQMSANAMALADIQTASVERHSVAHEVRMVGKIAFDETRLAYLTSWVSGRLDRLYVDYTGVTVRAEDHLAEIYSPTLYSAQQELLQSIATSKRLAGGSLDIIRSTSDLTVISAKEKLRLYGLSEEQIDALVKIGKPETHVTMMAPFGGVVVHKNAVEGMYVKEGDRIYTIADLSKVWVLLDAYESDLAWLRYGQDVEFQVAAFPGENFHGRVAFINPLLNDRTRTVKVRLNVDNSDGRLKPDMFVSATAQAVLTAHGRVVDRDLAGKYMCPMHPEVISDAEGFCSECGMALVAAAELGFATEGKALSSLVIPSTAPLITGRRAVVYVKLRGKERPTFEGREIALGPRAGDWYVVREGLLEGEEVVVKGNFKIDSELQIRAQPSMMNPTGGRQQIGHTHGDSMQAMGDAQASGDPQAMQDLQGTARPKAYAAPEGFRRQLGKLVDAYLHLQVALAADQLGAEESEALFQAVMEVDMGSLEGEGHKAWMRLQPQLKGRSEALLSAFDIGTRRHLLSPMSDALVEALKRFGYQRERGQVGLFECPMAVDGGPASWIQEGAEVINPYMGSSMLGCGSFNELLPQGN